MSGLLKMEIRIDPEQKKLLKKIAHLQTQKNKQKVSIAELVRQSVEFWLEKKGKKLLSETDLILMSSNLLQDIDAALEEVGRGKVHPIDDLLKKRA